MQMPRIVPSQVVELIDQLFPAAKSQKDSKDKRFTLDRHSQNELAAIIDLVEHIPPELITLDTKTYSGLQMAITAIRTTVLNWEHQSHGLELIKGYGNLNPVTIIRNALAQCPDESIAQTTSDLNFISDPDFRKNLRIDISSANQAFINGEWKAATILSGAIIEALLLFVLQPIQEKDLSEITVAINNLVSKNRLKKPLVLKCNNKRYMLSPWVTISTVIVI